MASVTGERSPVAVAHRRVRAAAATRDVVGGAIGAAWRHRIFGLAAEAGFWQLLSLAPLLLGLLGVLGYFADDLAPHTLQHIQNNVLHTASRFMVPSAVNTLVRPAVVDILHGGRADVVSVGFVLSLWSGSSAVATYVNTITIAYGLRDRRSAWRSRLLALELYLGGVVVGVVVLPLLVVGPEAIIDAVPGSVTHLTRDLVTAAYWPVVAVLSALLLATLYHLSVPVRTPWHRDLPGAVVAMGLWLAFSEGVRLYFSIVFRHQSTYGPLAAPTAVLLFFYLTALAVLFGAELNAQIDRRWPTEATRLARRDAEGSGA